MALTVRRMAWTGALTVALGGTVSLAQGNCPVPPNPNNENCPLAVNRATLTEQDLDGNDQPDNSGSIGGFCAGDSPADCVGFATAEVGLNLVVPNPALQAVTCTAPGLDIWIMSDLCGGCLVRGFGSVTLPAGTTTDTTLEIVVADVNGDICPCGPLLACTYSRETFCADGADGDGDGLIDAADPDCCADGDGDGYCGAADCDDTDGQIHAVPGVLELLALSKSGGMTAVGWSVPPPELLDIVSGSLAALRASGTFALAVCLADDLGESPFIDPRGNPTPGNGYYYVARSQNDCGPGSYGDSQASTNPREQLDAASPCPY